MFSLSVSPLSLSFRPNNLIVSPVSPNNLSLRRTLVTKFSQSKREQSRSSSEAADAERKQKRESDKDKQEQFDAVQKELDADRNQAFLDIKEDNLAADGKNKFRGLLDHEGQINITKKRLKRLQLLLSNNLTEDKFTTPMERLIQCQNWMQKILNDSNEKIWHDEAKTLEDQVICGLYKIKMEITRDSLDLIYKNQTEDELVEKLKESQQWIQIILNNTKDDEIFDKACNLEDELNSVISNSSSSSSNKE